MHTSAPRLERFGKNPKGGRDFVIPDLHGELEIFLDAMRHIQLDEAKDRVFFLGDLIDRGPHSVACLRLLERDCFRSILGNHEDMFLEALTTRDYAHWFQNGGTWAREYIVGEDNRGLTIANDDLWYIAQLAWDLPLGMTVEVGDQTFGLIHADAYGDFEDACRNEESALWGRMRSKFKDDRPVTGVDHVFCGHTIVAAPETLGNVTFLDLGATKNKKLTIVDLNEVVRNGLEAGISTYIGKREVAK
ncbi:metallophosphoesterase [Reinekea sp. G2M2-21]|uniref:metallophosphoesterase n=1 Tax=Reinekea sp. G2M2-21 TaxID=2788942 RepID=UPI0018AA8DE4|nr:metallophosphoesterase [Reinekea sp. G2M2-21]